MLPHPHSALCRIAVLFRKKYGKRNIFAQLERIEQIVSGSRKTENERIDQVISTVLYKQKHQHKRCDLYDKASGRNVGVLPPYPDKTSRY